MKLYLFVIFCMVCSLLSAQEPAVKQDLKVGLVLSGGGAKGLAHIGVLKVLEEAGIRIDYIGGTSMGAMVGAMYAAGYSANELDSIFRSLDFDKLLQDKNHAVRNHFTSGIFTTAMRWHCLLTTSK